MALQQVNVGAIPNDGTGDDPRTGISKVNANMGLLEATGVNGVDQVFTEVNLNPTTFGGIGAGDKLMESRTHAATLIDFFIDSSYVVVPTLSSITGTFAIQDKQGNVVDSGITAGDIAVNGTSSNKCLIIRVSGLSLTINDNYVLVSESASSEIVVNG